MKNMFYNFQSAYKKSEIRIQAHFEYNKSELLGKDSPLIANNRFSIAKGKKCFDILPFDDSSNFAISEKLKKILEDNHVTGWSCFPVIIEGLDANYYAFQTLSMVGPILNLDAINNFEEELIKFDESTWDGSDIFTLEYTSITACVPKVKDLLEKAKITNIEILPL